MILTRDNLLIYRYRNETVHVEPWGANAVRVRATKNPAFPENDWALASRPSAQAEITVSPEGAVLTNGKIRLSLSNNGKITVYNQKDERILEEDTRKFCALKIEAREFRPIPGGDYHLTARFQSLDPNERVYGMGQYQQPYLNLKGTDLELAHRNSQAWDTGCCGTTPPSAGRFSEKTSPALRLSPPRRWITGLWPAIPRPN